ncbi:formate dehydrogenase accessory sulfurtransferase FdhD [Achromobacter piechaudii]|uniref:Sulfur carrier protein FdhD n=2 Tax=Achromobacter piechaudii TaxID=72556 RepID=A0ABN7F5W8_9BURK|nr:formate dehydrogenase accessory sulfurtransferase FdhD [Achromobacter piechaudii]EFF73659.1 formate dehydrogenase family accessory protein FdhD [Achromobacter piechaudii ATCC 43553]CAB3734077.1 Sulfur carrier protein FdhD [Achromobacter piechaudii]CAB3914344.1 Sulfur carrier protein FdhD [Achromobacter piechaudii]CAB3955281.1 Sulfur carrier protein FdhD [Achromobacter piechaudii]
MTSHTPTPPRPDCSPTQVTRVRDGAIAPATESDFVAEETPVALEFNGISHATMLASPADLEDFAVGFSLSEGIIDSVSDVRGIDVLPQCDGIVVQVEISSACEVRLKTRRRAMAGRTGCGLCGVETLPEVLRPVAPVTNGSSVRIRAVLAAMRDMRTRQALHDITGATHAAGWAGGDGAVALLREDVGRHNALDKLIGALARQAMHAGDGIVLVSSRASFEMVQKTAAAGVAVLAAVSAPTALAIRLARDANVSLVGFLRGDDATLYTHPERLIP